MFDEKLRDNKSMEFEMNKKEFDSSRISVKFASKLTLGPNFNEKVLIDDFLDLV